jgi:hypothetical protein
MEGVSVQVIQHTVVELPGAGYAMLCDVMFTICGGQDTFTPQWHTATALIYF